MRDLQANVGSIAQSFQTATELGCPSNNPACSVGAHESGVSMTR